MQAKAAEQGGVAMAPTYKRVAPYIRTYTPDVGRGVELEAAAS